MQPAFVRKGFVRGPTLIKHFLAFGLITISITAAAFGRGDIQQVNSDDFRGLLKMGDKLVRRGEYPEAEKVFKRAIGINPNHSGVKLKLALVYLKQRRLTNAYDLAFPLAKSEPTNSNAYAVLGATMLSAGKFREA